MNNENELINIKRGDKIKIINWGLLLSIVVDSALFLI
jgi:hypothetical protein